MTALKAEAASCRHCGSPVPEGAGDPQFCCIGCAGAFSLIHDLGLDSYYQRRVENASPKPDETPPEGLADSVTQRSDGQCSLDLAVDGLTCAACVWLIESVLARHPQVTKARVNMTTRRLSLGWQGPAELADRLAGDVSRLGYRLAPFLGAGLETDHTGRDLVRCLAVAGFAAMNIMLLSVGIWAGAFQGIGGATRDLFHWVSALIALPAVAYAGRPFFRSALGAIRAGGTNMDVPISIGVLLATGASLFETARSASHAYFDGATMLLFFLLIGRVLDHRARGQARVAVGRMLSLRSTSVRVLTADGQTAARRPDRVQPGERVLVATGERLGIDGRLEQAGASLDTSMITGESLPRTYAAGEAVFAGMVNLGAPVVVRTSATGEQTLLAEIIRLIEAAEQGRGRFVALADRVARAYAPVVHVAAALTFLGWWGLSAIGWNESLAYAISVLIITCPCALALAVPVVQVIAAGRLLKRGILLKTPTALERLAAVDRVVFDKTGTLTEGHPVLTGTYDPSVLRRAAGLALSSRHPLARALVQAAGPCVAVRGVEEVPGAGLQLAETRLGSRRWCGIASEAEDAAMELWFCEAGTPPVRFTFADRLRHDAADAVRVLERQGVSVAMLSGDRGAVVAQVAAEAGITRWDALQTPVDKVAALKAMAQQGHQVAMVGDGLNDAPALGAAGVSLAPASAVDIAQVQADIVFQGDGLSAVPFSLRIARLSQKLARQNLWIALGYNAVAMPMAMAGHVTPLIAALSMSASSVLVIANAFRLSREG